MIWTIHNNVPSLIRRCLLVFAAVGGMSVVAENARCDNATILPKDLSKPYIERQTYKEGGQSFYKDNNIWVYSPFFAKAFGMPPENIYPELKGIEAAAFRIEDPGYKLCGMGGKGENCMTQYRCVTDVYIDESKYPLPWATNNQADWYVTYNSLQWLQIAGDVSFYPNPPEGVKPSFKPNTYSSLRPFADSETHLEASWVHNANAPFLEFEKSAGGVRIFGYKRKAIANLSMITLDYNCLPRNSEKRVVKFRLANMQWTNSRLAFIKIFHEFELPDEFHKKMDARLQEKQNRDEAYYLQILNQQNKK